VFAGTFDLAAVGAVCSDEDLPAPDLPDLLHHLADKSLVVTHPRPDGGMRYRLLEVVRQYARERLLEGGETDPPARHARHYTALVRKLAEDGGPAAIERLNAECDNVWLAMDWVAAADPGVRADFADLVKWYLSIRGVACEGGTRLLAAIAEHSGHSAHVTSRHVGAATWLRLAGDRAEAREQLDEALSLVESVGDVTATCRMLNLRGHHLAQMGDLGAAEASFCRALDLLSDRPADDDLLLTLSNLAFVRLLDGRPEQALSVAGRAVDVWTTGRATSTAVIAQLTGQVHAYGAALLQLGRVPDAWRHFVRGLEAAVVDGGHRGAVAPLLGLSCVAAAQGDLVDAMVFLGSARRCVRMCGLRTTSLPATPVGEAERSARRTLGDAAADEALAAGLEMDPAEALERARQADRGPVLPARKAEIVRLVAAGLTNKEIARRMSISQRTVEAHLDQIRTPLGLHNRAQLAAWAMENGLAERQDGEIA
jgi:non-specific serine/threonine protein kinase